MVLVLLAGRIVVNEVMANPAGVSGAHQPEDRNEFVELYNPGAEAVDLLGWTIDDLDAADRLVAWLDSSLLAAHPTLLLGTTWLAPGGYAVVLDPEYTDPEPTGGHVRPYRFGSGALVLTVGNTTIGNGLATTDPVVLASPYGDTSTYGTPGNDEDSLPCNPGDGLSWERVDPAGPDTAGNWAVCRDSAGSTPGMANSITSRPDLAVTALDVVGPDSLAPGTPFACSVTVANVGYVAAEEWSLDLFLDVDRDAVPGPGESQRHFPGRELVRGRDTAFGTSLPCPEVRVDLCARLECPEDVDTSDNLLRVLVGPATGELLRTLGGSFSPDGDGFEDSLRLVYRLTEPGGNLQVVIFDLAGRRVRELHAGEPPGLEGMLVWDGRRADGRPAPTGVYAVWYRHRLSRSARDGKLAVALYRR